MLDESEIETIPNAKTIEAPKISDVDRVAEKVKDEFLGVEVKLPETKKIITKDSRNEDKEKWFQNLPEEIRMFFDNNKYTKEQVITICENNDFDYDKIAVNISEIIEENKK